MPVIPGNHDRPVENDAATFREVFADHGIRLLINETVEIEGFHFFGSPYTPTCRNRAGAGAGTRASKVCFSCVSSPNRRNPPENR
jgi:hypothetical protein